MEVTADPARVNDNLRWSCGSMQIQQLQNPVNWAQRCNSRGNQPLTALRCLSSPPVMKVPRFMNMIFYFFFPFQTCGVLITGSDLWGSLNWNGRGVLQCAEVGSAARQGNWTAGFPSWNHWERRCPCCRHCCRHNDKCLSSFSRIIFASSNVSLLGTKWLLWYMEIKKKINWFNISPTLLQTPRKPIHFELGISPAFIKIFWQIRQKNKNVLLDKD